MVPRTIPCAFPGCDVYAECPESRYCLDHTEEVWRDLVGQDVNVDRDASPPEPDPW